MFKLVKEVLKKCISQISGKIIKKIHLVEYLAIHIHFVGTRNNGNVGPYFKALFLNGKKTFFFISFYSFTHNESKISFHSLFLYEWLPANNTNSTTGENEKQAELTITEKLASIQ